MRTTQRQQQRGMTLLELMMALGISSILGASFFMVMNQDFLTYLHRMDELDSQQNARAALTMLRRTLQQARYGLASGTDVQGIVPIGECYSDADSSLSQRACNNLTTDGGADRLRVVSLLPDASLMVDTPHASGTGCDGTGGIDPSRISIDKLSPVPWVAGTLLGIGGPCQGASSVFSNHVVKVTADSGPGNDCNHRLSFDPFLTTPTIPCGLGFGANYNVGRAQIVDVFIAKDSDGLPNLMWRSNPLLPLASAEVIAYGIEDLQLSYGIDEAIPPTGYVTRWCSDPRLPSDGGTDCTITTGLTAQQLYQRIVAVRATIRVRTLVLRERVPSSTLNPNDIVANPVVDVADAKNRGLHRWIYRTVVDLRNTTL